MTDTLTTRQNIRCVLSGAELEYFDRLCALEDADEGDAIEAGRRYTALEHGIKLSGNSTQALENAEKFLTFLSGGKETA